MMKARDFIVKCAMGRHIENGAFIEMHYASDTAAGAGALSEKTAAGYAAVQ